MAIETVYIQSNTSVVQDEVLSHRLGLIPILADPNLFEFFDNNEDATDQNTIVFKLDVECVQSKASALSTTEEAYTENVTSDKLEWQPQGDQEERFPSKTELIE